LVCIFVIIPSSYFIFLFGKRASLIIAASLNAIGGCLHYAGIHQNGFHFILAGQIATALGVGIILQLPVGIATSWFGSNEQAKATSIGVLANILGIAVGFAQPGSMVPDVTDKIVLKEKLFNLFISQLVFLVINLVTVYLFFYDNPKLPPSYSAGLQKNTSEENKLSFFQSVKMLVGNKPFNIQVHSFGIVFGLNACIVTILDQLLISILCQNDIGWLGFTINISGVAGIYLSGVVNDKLNKYRLVAIVITFGTLLAWIILTFVSIHVQSKVLIFVNFGVIGFFGGAFWSHSLSSVAEMTYPVSEMIAGSIITMFGCLYAFLFVYVIGAFVDGGHIKLSLYVMMGLYTAGFIMACSTKIQMKRQELNKNIIHENENESLPTVINSENVDIQFIN